MNDYSPDVTEAAPEIVTADRLIGPRGTTESGLPEDLHHIAGVGAVRIRGLSRKEAHIMSSAKGAEEREIAIVKYGVVAPKLNRGQIMQWQQNSPAGELQKLTSRITELSGMNDENLAKEIYKSLREEL